MKLTSEWRDAVLTPAQVETIETNPLYPCGLDGVSYDVMSGAVEVTFGEVRFRVMPDGRVKAPTAGDVYDRMAEIEAQIRAVQRKVDELTGLVKAMMTPEQLMRCPAPTPALAENVPGSTTLPHQGRERAVETTAVREGPR